MPRPYPQEFRDHIEGSVRAGVTTAEATFAGHANLADACFPGSVLTLLTSSAVLRNMTFNSTKANLL